MIASYTTNEEDTPIRKDKNNKKGNSDRESDHIYTWNSISFSRIKGYPRLNFIIEKLDRSMPKVEIFRNRVIAIVSENAYSNLGLVLQKIRSYGIFYLQ